LFVRNLNAGLLLESFLIAAVASMLGVRALLGVTGYPRIGGGGLHIAHMLWGGGLMLVGILLLLSYLGARIRRLAAVIAGLGFGLFIDELGKFITSDNNYFYRPAIALIYVVFVLLFLWWRSFERRRTWTPETYLANALMLLQDAALHDLDSTEKFHLIQWFRRSGSAGTNLLGNLEDALIHRRPDVAQESRITAWLRSVRKRITNGLRSRWAGRLAVLVVIIRAVGALTTSVALAIRPGTPLEGETIDTPLLVSTILAAGLVVIGLASWRWSRVRALRWFRRSILASIFLTDLFTFYYQQLGALADLGVDLILLGVFEALIDDEHRRTELGQASLTVAR
jgi:hypothetical protein